MPQGDSRGDGALLINAEARGFMAYTKEQLERRKYSAWEYDDSGRPARAILSYAQAMSTVSRYGRRGTTADQKEAIAQYMIDHNTALLKAEAAVLGVEDLSGEKAENFFAEFWLTR